MRSLRWLVGLAMLAAIAYSARELTTVAGLMKSLAASPAPGAAVIINADGSRLELPPSQRSRTTLAERVAASLSKAEPPALDDPRAGLAERKRRAEFLMLASVLSVFVMLFWARRWRP